MHIMEVLRKSDEWRKSCINLIASENVMSPLAAKAYMSDFMHRYAEGAPYNRYYQGTKFIDFIEERTLELARDMFGCKQVDLRPLSGSLANMCAFAALAKPGDCAISQSVTNGAHITHQRFGALGITGVEVDFFEFDYKEFNIDVPASSEKIKEKRPKVVTFGSSLFLAPQPVSELSKVAHDVGASVVYDAAHVLGLIAAGRFQQPFEEGADLITASTHKTFPGPQGGIILGKCDDLLWAKVDKKIFPGLVSNHHLHRLPALYVTLLEFKNFGKEYADQTIRNAQALAKALNARGFEIVGKPPHYTWTHQVAINASKIGGAKVCSETLEDAYIIANMNLIPGDDPKKPFLPSGIRFGVQEMTRFGMKEPQIIQIADMIKELLLDKRPAAEVRAQAIELRTGFRDVCYCFRDEGELNDAAGN